ncbi:hypothetical protein CROQUDRAFT_241309 [Cronartium quercuum f. sp. fusiforme G11]|uniref:Uncharacterized protein n=1 Tax=Cronartium quercuum f. sp. fusiforme G11 TaxID=708437 RepID=A0A9P6T7P3_9BASI|nr:hypothetical protein CROQUDRAFT_241309 [Cronartium quercuum f. sp. fusiforme G11]
MDENLQLIQSQLLPPMETNYETAISLKDIVLRSYQAILSRIRPSYKLPKQTDVGQTLFDPVWNPEIFEVAGFSPLALRFFFVLHELLQDFYLLLASERSSIASTRGVFSVSVDWLRQKWRQSNICNFIIGERYQNHKKYKKLRHMKEYQSHELKELAKSRGPLDLREAAVSETKQPLANERVTSNSRLSARENQDGSGGLRDELSTLRRRSILHPFEYSPISPKVDGKFRPEEFYRQAKQFQQDHVHNTHGDMSFKEAAALLENIFHDYSDGFTKLYATYSQIDEQFWPHFRWSVGAAHRP